MTERLNDRDWRLISAFLDARLSPAETARVERRIKEDLFFKKSLDEIAYTKRLLAALPQKSSPRNFTLVAEKVKQPLRGLWLQPALSFISVAAAALLVVVFSFNYLGMGMARHAAAPQAEMLAADSAVAEQQAPVIINWNPVLGMGGGDGTVAKEVYTGGDGIGGAGGPGFPVPAPGVGGGEPQLPPAGEPEEVVTAEPGLEFPAAPVPVEPAPAAASEALADDADPSTLILGLPEPEDAGMMIESAPLREEPATAPRNALPVPTLIMIIAGITAFLAGAGALILRKITHA